MESPQVDLKRRVEVCVILVFFVCPLFHEFECVPFEFFLARQTAKMVGFAFVSDLKLGCVLVEDGTADRVSKHYF